MIVFTADAVKHQWNLQNPNLRLPLKLLVKTEQGQGHRLVRRSMVGLVK